MRRMNLAKVIEHEMQRHGMGVILDLLAKRVRQAREAAHMHSHREVLALNVAGRNMALVGVAGNHRALCADESRWAVATRHALRGRRLAVALFEHSVIRIGAEDFFNRFGVVGPAVRSDLRSTDNASREVVQKLNRRGRGAWANHVGHHQAAVGIDGGPRPHIAPFVEFLFWHVLLLRADKRPDFINLQPRRLDVPDVRIVIGRARGAKVAQQLFHSHAGDAGDARRAAQRIALNQRRNHANAIRRAQSVHTRQYTYSAKHCQGEVA